MYTVGSTEKVLELFKEYPNQTLRLTAEGTDIRYMINGTSSNSLRDAVGGPAIVSVDTAAKSIEVADTGVLRKGETLSVYDGATYQTSITVLEITDGTNFLYDYVAGIAVVAPVAGNDLQYPSDDKCLNKDFIEVETRLVKTILAVASVDTGNEDWIVERITNPKKKS